MSNVKPMYFPNDPEYSQRFLYLLDMTNKQARKYIHGRFKKLNIDLTYDQWQVLKEVALNENNINQKNLAFSITKDDASVMRILVILTHTGYVIKEKLEGDKRFSTLRLTEKGREFYDNYNDAINKIHDRIFWDFTEGEIKIVESVLKKTHKNFSL
jgi:DNA-binding MarR family transcriptional regulator